jgi:hypothetical protein
MKRLLLVYLSILITASCTHKETFKVEGEVPDSTFEGSKVYLVALDGPISKDVDSTIVTNGSFNFEKKADSLCVKILRVPVRYPNYVEDLVVVLEPGNLKVVLSPNSHGEGTRLNNILQNWKEKKHAYDSLQFVIYSQMRKEPDKNITDSLLKYSESLSCIYKAELKGLMNENLNNGIGLFLFKIYYHDFSMEDKSRILKLTRDLYSGKDAQLKKMIDEDQNIGK